MNPGLFKEKQQHVPWTLRDMVYAGIVALCLLALGLSAVMGLLAFVDISPTDSLSSGMLVLLVFSLEVLLLPPVWWWGLKKYERGWRSMGLRRFPWLISGALFFFGLVLILLINFLWELLRRQLGWAAQPDVLPLFGGGIQGLALALFLGGVIAPLTEEIFFRGFVYAGLRSRWGTVWGMVVSSLLFALIHLSPSVILPIFLMGMVLAFVYTYSGSLWPTIFLHGAINAMAFVGSYISSNYPGIFGM
ncbi:MAG: CPBP family intramembrane glutamic endopeptidase [Anaerolineales bacterium]